VIYITCKVCNLTSHIDSKVDPLKDFECHDGSHSGHHFHILPPEQRSIFITTIENLHGGKLRLSLSKSGDSI
jgi:hypothetical protein